MIPLSRRNETQRPAYVTMAFVAINVLVWIVMQGRRRWRLRPRSATWPDSDWRPGRSPGAGPGECIAALTVPVVAARRGAPSHVLWFFGYICSNVALAIRSSRCDVGARCRCSLSLAAALVGSADRRRRSQCSPRRARSRVHVRLPLGSSSRPSRAAGVGDADLLGGAADLWRVRLGVGGGGACRSGPTSAGSSPGSSSSSSSSVPIACSPTAGNRHEEPWRLSLEETPLERTEATEFDTKDRSRTVTHEGAGRSQSLLGLTIGRVAGHSAGESCGEDR